MDNYGAHKTPKIKNWLARRPRTSRPAQTLRKGRARSWARLFLKRVAGDLPWTPLDIAGAAWGGKNISYLNANTPTGYGVRLLTRWALNEAARCP